MSTTAIKTKPGKSNATKAEGSTRKGSSRTSAKSKRASAKSRKAAPDTKRTSAGSKTSGGNKNGGSRLSPGALDGLVVGYMKRNRAKLPATSGVVGRGIKRSPGAIANCLERLEKAGKVKLTNKKPREYDLA